MRIDFFIMNIVLVIVIPDILITVLHQDCLYALLPEIIRCRIGQIQVRGISSPEGEARWGTAVRETSCEQNEGKCIPSPRGRASEGVKPC